MFLEVDGTDSGGRGPHHTSPIRWSGATRRCMTRGSHGLSEGLSFPWVFQNLVFQSLCPAPSLLPCVSSRPSRSPSRALPAGGAGVPGCLWPHAAGPSHVRPARGPLGQLSSGRGGRGLPSCTADVFPFGPWLPAPSEQPICEGADVRVLRSH